MPGGVGCQQQGRKVSAASRQTGGLASSNACKDAAGTLAILTERSSPPMPSSIGMSCLPPRPPAPHPPHPAHPTLSHPTHRHSQASCAFQATRRSQRRSSRSDRKRWREAHSPVCTTRLKPASTAAARCSAVLACRHRGYDGGTGGRGGRVSCRGGRVKLIAAFVTAPGLPKRSWAAAAEGTAGCALWGRAGIVAQA